MRRGFDEAGAGMCTRRVEADRHHRNEEAGSKDGHCQLMSWTRRGRPHRARRGRGGDVHTRRTKCRPGAQVHDHKGVPRTETVRGTPLSVEVSDATGEAPRSYRTRSTDRPFPSPHSSPTRTTNHCSSLPRASCPRLTEERGRQARRDGRSHARWDPRRPS